MAEEDLIKHLERHDRELSKIRNKFLVPATENTAGLMSPQARRDLTHALGMRQWIYNKTSVFDLPEGKYETTWNNLTDTPIPENEKITEMPPYCEIDVEQAVSGTTRKQIRFFYSLTGEIWYRNIHASSSNINNTPRLWRRVEGRTLLWSGSVSDVGSTITLADSLKNYTRMEIGYGALRKPERSDFDLGGDITLRDFNMPSDSSLWTAFYETVLSNDGDKTLKITQASGILRNSSSALSADENKIYITSIRGIR